MWTFSCVTRYSLCLSLFLSVVAEDLKDYWKMIQEEPTSSCNEGQVDENQHSPEAGQSGDPESQNSSNEVYIIFVSSN